MNRDSQKAATESFARRVKGVRAVINKIEVEPTEAPIEARWRNRPIFLKPCPQAAGHLATGRLGCAKRSDATTIYYVPDRPKISDEENERLFNELKRLEEQHPDLVTPDPPAQRVAVELAP